MAGYRSSFGENLDYAAGGGRTVGGRARNLGGELERSMASVGQFIQARNVAKREVKSLERELAGINKALNPALWERTNRQLSEMKKNLGNLPFQAAEKGLGRLTKGLVELNVSILGIGFNFLINSIKRVYELQERWTRAVGAFNLKIGGMTGGLKGAQRAATQWSGVIRGLTDGDIREGIEMFGEFTMAMSRTIKMGDGFVDLGLQVARGMNLGGQGAGELLRVLENIGNTSKEATELLGRNLVAAAKNADIPVNMLAKDILDSSKYMARFGKEGQKTFVQGAAYARKFTMSIEQLKGAVEGLDMFDEAAQTASKLNTVFGTMVNSIDLMMADDPAQRIELIRQQFLAQGRTFDTMLPKQRRYLAETLHLTEDQVAALLDAKNAGVSYADFQQKQAALEKQEISAKKNMEMQLRATAQTMYSFGAAFDRITIAIGKAIKPLLVVFGLAKSGDKDFKSFGARMESITVTIEKFFESLARDEGWNQFMVTLANDLKKLGSALKDFVLSGRAAKFMGELARGMKTFYTFVKDLAVAVAPALKPLVAIFLALSKHLDKIVIAWLSLKALGGLGALGGGAGGAMGMMGAAFAAPQYGGTFGGMQKGGVGKFAPSMQGAGARGSLSMVGGLATGAALGSSGAMTGGAIGGAIGVFIPIIGPLLGPLGAALGHGIEKLFGSSDAKSKLEKAIEDREKAQKEAAISEKRLTSIKELGEARRLASMEKNRQADAALLKLKERKGPLDADEITLAMERIKQLQNFGLSTDSAKRALDNLEKGGPLDKTVVKDISDSLTNYKTVTDKLTKSSSEFLEMKSIEKEISALELKKKMVDAQEAATKFELKDLEEKKKSLDDQIKESTELGFGQKALGGVLGAAGADVAFRTLNADNIKTQLLMKEKNKYDKEINDRMIKVEDAQKDLAKQTRDIMDKAYKAQIRGQVLGSKTYENFIGKGGQPGDFLTGPNAEQNIQDVIKELSISRNNFKEAYGFAGGGIVTRPTYGLIGEAGPEAVIPLRAMARGRMRAPMSHGGSMANGMVYGGGGGSVRVVSSVADVNIDGRKVGEAIVRTAITSGE